MEPHSDPWGIMLTPQTNMHSDTRRKKTLHVWLLQETVNYNLKKKNVDVDHFTVRVDLLIRKGVFMVELEVEWRDALSWKSCRDMMVQLRSEAMKTLGGREGRRQPSVYVCVCVCVRACTCTSVCVHAWPDGSSVWRPARGTGAGHMTSRYHGDGDCSWREDERRRAPGTERGWEMRGRREARWMRGRDPGIQFLQRAT